MSHGAGIGMLCVQFKLLFSFRRVNYIIEVCYFVCSSWSRKLIERASKTQYVDLPSVNLTELRERGIVVRCANFSVEALRSHENKKAKKATLLPVITSDKKTFNIPDDVYNPAFQVSVTLYHYPDKCGCKFLCKRETENTLNTQYYF